jgi:hypothetical protein
MCGGAGFESFFCRRGTAAWVVLLHKSSHKPQINATMKLALITIAALLTLTGVAGRVLHLGEGTDQGQGGQGPNMISFKTWLTLNAVLALYVLNQ